MFSNNNVSLSPQWTPLFLLVKLFENVFSGIFRILVIVAWFDISSHLPPRPTAHFLVIDLTNCHSGQEVAKTILLYHSVNNSNSTSHVENLSSIWFLKSDHEFYLCLSNIFDSKLIIYFTTSRSATCIFLIHRFLFLLLSQWPAIKLGREYHSAVTLNAKYRPKHSIWPLLGSNPIKI